MLHSVFAFVSDTSFAGGATSLLDAAIKGGALLLAAGVVVLAMQRASASMRHLVWTAGLLSLLVLPLLSVVVPRWEALPEWLRAESIVGMVAVPEAAEVATLAPELPTSPLPELASRDAALNSSLPLGDAPFVVHSPPAASPLPELRESGRTDVAPASSGPVWLAASLWIWGAVAAVLVLRIAFSRFILGRVVRSAAPIDDGPIFDQIAVVRRRFRIGHVVYAYLSGDRELPMTWGLFRTHVLLPSDAPQWPPGRLEAVLLHELAHVKRRDTITHVLGQVACAVHWFNPLVWLAAWRIHVERERACDDLVVTSGVKSSDYAEHLLRIVGNCRSRRAVPCSAVAMARPSRLEGRLLAILNERINRRAATSGFLAAVLATGLVGVIAVAMLRAQDSADNKLGVHFGETIELVVSNDTGETPLVDFDRGKVGAVPDELKRGKDEAAIVAWMAENGYDAVGETGRNLRGLIGIDMIARYGGNGEWNMPLAHVQARLAIGKPGSPTVMPAHAVPATYFIRTREGGTGIVQIVGFEDQPKGVRIRFKMLAGDPASGEDGRATIDREVSRLIDQVNALIAAALAERYDEAAKLAGPGFPRGQLEDFAQLDVGELEVETLYLDSANALAISALLPVDNPGGLELGRLVLTLEKKESWRLRDIDFETDESLQGEIDRFREEHPDAERIEAGSQPTRRFVRLVVGLDGAMTFEGNATTWEELPAALEKVPQRADTVLEFAITTEQLTVAQLNEFRIRASKLASDHGFEYASYIGVHPLGSMGSPEAERDDRKGAELLNRELNPNEAAWLVSPTEHLDGFVFVPKQEDERFDPAARLAGLTATEASTLDELLRSHKFDGFDALKAYDPAKYAGDAIALQSALDKLFELEAKQAAELSHIEGRLESDTLSGAERSFLEQQIADIRHQSAKGVLSIRQAFRPTVPGEAKANWTALFKSDLGNGEDHYMLMAHVPCSGVFPVRFEGEDQERFRVRVLGGDDDALSVKAFFEIDGVPINQAEEKFELVRDRPVEFEVNGERFSILFASTYIARSSPSTTELATIIVSYRPQAHKGDSVHEGDEEARPE